MPYDVTTDPTAFLILDDRSTFTTAGGVGTQVTGVSNVSASGLAYDAVVGHTYSTGATLSVDGSGHNFLTFDGGSTLKVPTSTGFDAEFTNTGDGGGSGLLVVFKTTPFGGSFGPSQLLSKQSASVNNGTAQVTIWDGSSGDGYVCRFGIAEACSQRPYAGGLASGCVTNESGTTGPGANYRDGSTAYFNGAPASKSNTNGAQLDLTDSAGFDLAIGGWPVVPNVAYFGEIHAVVVWNRCPKHHEVLATHRHYAARYGMPETLTNQPYALVWEGNSESCVQSSTEPGIADRVAAGIGTSTNASFMLAKAARSGAQIVYDYPAWTAPLISYLVSLGMTVPLHLWELVNDAYGLAAAAEYVDYWGLVNGSGAKFSVSTAMCTSTYTSSLVGAGNVVAVANAQVLADGAADGYPVGRIGTDPASAMAAYDAADFDDGVHWNTAGVALGYPYFLAAVAASLATPTSFTLTAAAGPSTLAAAFTVTVPAGTSFRLTAAAGPSTLAAAFTAGPAAPPTPRPDPGFSTGRRL